MASVLIMHQTIVKHDAIGNDIEELYQLLKEKYDCYCYAENKLNNSLKYVDKKKAREIILNSDNIVIYHHSANWENGESLIQDCKAKLIFRYHNITPSDFFAPYCEKYKNSCELGRKQTERLIEKYPEAFWLSDSIYNSGDLKEVPTEKIEICAPFHKIEEWTRKRPDENILKSLIHNNKINILFVGRVAPNKGHFMLLEILHTYIKNFGNDIKLYVIGKFDDALEEYNKLIRQKIANYHMVDQIEFIGEINDSTLMAYYLGTDIFLCTSDHEGFCVPIIEAQRLGLPIIAKDSCAVPETIGKNQLILNEDIAEYVAAIKLIANDKAYREYLINNGIYNFESRFSHNKINKNFEEIWKRWKL